MAQIYIALLHHPVYNKNKDVVTTNITGFDLHDIARSCATYGVSRYFVINPIPSQREFAQRIIDCWKREQSYTHNWTRAEAFERIRVVSTLDEALEELKKPIIIATSAKSRGGIKFSQMRNKIKKSRRSFLILLGTGWGMTKDLLDRADYLLEPIKSRAAYNHLSVRSAAAIILDRLLGGN